MNRYALIRFTVAALSGAAAGVSIIAILAAVSPQGISGCAVVSGWGVLVPIVTGLFVGSAAWGFLSVQDEPPLNGRGMQRCDCPVCGGTILGDWRLCPHCGARLTAGTTAD